MAIIFEHSAEGSTDEADVAANQTGYGTPWPVISKVGGTTIKYDSAQAMHGTRSIRFDRSVNTDNGYLRADASAAVARLQARAYYRLSALPASGRFFGFRSASGAMGYIGKNSAGRVQAFDSANSGINASLAANPLPTATWIRIEAAIKKGATTTDGTLEYAYYLGDSTTAEASWSGTTVNTGTADPLLCRFQSPDGTAVITMWMDDAALGDSATGWIGPTTAVPPVAVVSGGVRHRIDATSSTLTSGTKTYSILQTSGPATSPFQEAAGVWTVVPHASSTLIYDVTVTGSLGGSDVETYSVPPLSSGSAAVQRLRKASGVFA